MINFETKSNLNLIILSLIGTVTAKETIKKVQLLKTTEKIKFGMNTIIDTRSQINVLTRDELLKIFFEMVGSEKDPFVRKTAIIAVSNEEFGTGSLYSVYKNKKKVEVVLFSDINNVIKWLKIPKDKKIF
jgi:hypothetical protein